MSAGNSNGGSCKDRGSLTDASMIDRVRLKKSACLWEVCISQTWGISIGEGLLLVELLAVTRSLVPKPERSTGRRKANRYSWMLCFHSRWDRPTNAGFVSGRSIGI